MALNRFLMAENAYYACFSPNLLSRPFLSENPPPIIDLINIYDNITNINKSIVDL